MGYSDGLDPHGVFAKGKALKAKLLALDNDILNYRGDHAGLIDLKHQQISMAQELAGLPST